MTTQEFSDEFDILLNSFYSKSSYKGDYTNQELVLNEYEKSVLLTQAQEEIVRELYNGSLTGESFERTEELRRCLDNLVRTIELEPFDMDYIGVTPNSAFFMYPEDTWFITYEQATVNIKGTNKTIMVVPMRQDEWHKVSNNPFKMPNKNKVIRLDCAPGVLELISDYTVSSYLIRYLCKPTPIILEELPDNLSIDGERDITECVLNTALHRVILDRAVKLAYSRITKVSN